MEQKVRLNDEQIKIIKDTITEVLNTKANIYIFGSRADLFKKGGDIDILVKVNNDFDNEKKFLLKKEIITKLYKKIGERKIDLIIIKEPRNSFEKMAIEQGKKI